ncbi:hypothetical protein J6590_050207 [Homalodisca vitripennis]|nr:hypothetical protein J6590_050207 [Homalodisca vitripennis]
MEVRIICSYRVGRGCDSCLCEVGVQAERGREFFLDEVAGVWRSVAQGVSGVGRLQGQFVDLVLVRPSFSKIFPLPGSL